ncbi:DUF6252 family protein [Hymenobacter sediminicola]|uniref:Uncharacterized protein n=1 Tax=Hymenobacter sediminicola TaxID=2761579 RepID=A0A7G7W6Z6_9BACT|nr:DUF6252 family protein [Hymenobacter sediminicola]QNH62139.1 hypothetical protein H4317_18650 [Hymenobacter sediminicola]
MGFSVFQAFLSTMRKLLLYSAILLLTQCSKCKDNDPNPLEQLPPATQTGANTFGCLVNGQAWTPKGYTGSSNNSVSYDPGYRFGTLNISAYRYQSKEASSREDITLFSDSLKTAGIYPLTRPGRQEGLFSGQTGQCDFYARDTHYRRGKLTITRLDIPGRVISGTFEFTLAKPGCDTIRVTKGRFDYKL